MATLKTLVVDDEPGIRSGIKRILSRYKVSYPFIEDDFDFELDEAEDGLVAIEKIKSQEFDIILLDNKLPGKEGIEILHFIKENNFDCAVMMITSFASLDLAVKATNEGAYNFVPKPFTPDELRTAVENIVKHLYLKRLSKNVKKSEKEFRFRFLSILAHELKSPINAVESYLRIISDKQLGENIDSYKKMLDRSIERIKGMRTLITDMLELSRVQSKNTENIKQEVDLCLIAHQIIEALEPMANEQNIKITVKFTDDCIYSCNENDMKIVFNNFISNAIKYNIKNGKIFVSINKLAENIELIFEDTGIGLTEEEIDLLFNEFVRIKNEKTKNIEGTGLGLSITKQIIEKYKGEIKVQSESNKGSKFIISLPL